MRYMLVMSLVLLVVSIILSVGKLRENMLKNIYMTAILLLLISVHSPLNMRSVSDNSQLQRLMSLLDKNHMLENNKVVSADIIDDADRKQIISIVEFFGKHDLNLLKPLFAEIPSSKFNKNNGEKVMVKDVIEDLGLKKR